MPSTPELKVRRKVNKDRKHPKGQGGHAARLNNRDNRRQGVLDRLEEQIKSFAGPKLEFKAKREEITSKIASLKEKWGW